jgi:hypothetical protein
LDLEARKIELRQLQEDLTARRPTIADLERLLERDDVDIDIAPDGRVTASEPKPQVRPLTMRENIGGEYGGSQC